MLTQEEYINKGGNILFKAVFLSDRSEYYVTSATVDKFNAEYYLDIFNGIVFIIHPVNFYAELEELRELHKKRMQGIVLLSKLNVALEDLSKAQAKLTFLKVFRVKSKTRDTLTVVTEPWELNNVVANFSFSKEKYEITPLSKDSEEFQHEALRLRTEVEKVKKRINELTELTNDW